MQVDTNAQADALTVLAGITGTSDAGATQTAEPVVAEKKVKAKLTPAEKAAALRAKAAELIKQAEAIESGQVAESKFKDIAKGWTATIKVGRAETRREVTGRVAFVSVEDGTTYVKVLVASDDGDVNIFKVRVVEVVSATAPATV